MSMSVQKVYLPFDKLIPEKSEPTSLFQRIWDAICLILFPIGIYKLTCHLIAKYQFSPFILGSSSTYVRELHHHKEEIETKNDTYLASLSDKEISAKKVQIKTKDGLYLDGVQITTNTQRTLDLHQQKYLVYILPAKAIWQQQLPELIALAKATKRNILCVNYRATGASSFSRPSSFKDLFCDIESSLGTLKGILKENTVLYAHSLGSATALYLSNKYKMKAVVQNTFHTLEGLTKLYSIPLINTIDKNQKIALKKQQELPIRAKKTSKAIITKLSLSKRVIYSLEDAFLSLPHLALRVTYFFLSFLDNICSLNFKKAKLDLKEIVKTICIDLTLTITGITAIFISLFSNQMNKLNGNLKNAYLERPALKTFAESPKFIWLAKKILKATGWSIDNAKMAQKIGKENLFIVQVIKDKTIPYEFSLAKALRTLDQTVKIHDLSDLLQDTQEDSHGFMASPTLKNRHTSDHELLKFLEEA